MKIIILKENILRALNILSRNISSRAQLPILANILIKTHEGKVILTSTNLETGIIYTLNAKVDRDGETTVSGRLFYELVNSSSGDKVEIEVEKDIMKLKLGRASSTLSCMSSYEFPPFPDIKGDKFSLSLKKLTEVLPRITIAASADEGRPVLTGVRMVIGKERITFMATDGYRLSLESIKTEEPLKESSVILPASSFDEMIRIAKETKSEKAQVYFLKEKNQVGIRMKEVDLFTRVIDGEFPDVERIIPHGGKTRAVLPVEDVLRSVKTASLFARGSSNIVKLIFGKAGITVFSSAPSVGTHNENIEAKIEGEDNEVSFNFRFLIDVLSIIGKGEIVFEMSGPLNPGLIKLENNSSDFMHIIMPVRVQSEDQ